MHAAYAHEPVKPVINGEVCQEGIAGSSWEDVQRFLFWSHLLSGSAGHGYGARGLWGCNTADHPSNHGSGGAPTWREAAELPGAHRLDPRTGETETDLLIEPEPDGTTPLRLGRFSSLPSWEDRLLVLTPRS